MIGRPRRLEGSQEAPEGAAAYTGSMTQPCAAVPLLV